MEAYSLSRQRTVPYLIKAYFKNTIFTIEYTHHYFGGSYEYMENIIITNNKLVYEKYKDSYEIVYNEEYTYLDVLEYVRNKIHEGHILATHPLSGSIKPNETPYKTVMISKNKKGTVDFDSLSIIESSIATAKKFMENKPTPKWTESILDDFRVIDLSLIENVINKLI